MTLNPSNSSNLEQPALKGLSNEYAKAGHWTRLLCICTEGDFTHLSTWPSSATTCSADPEVWFIDRWFTVRSVAVVVLIMLIDSEEIVSSGCLNKAECEGE